MLQMQDRFSELALTDCRKAFPTVGSAAKALAWYLKRFGGSGMTLRRDTRKAPANEGGYVLRGAGRFGNRAYA